MRVCVMDMLGGETSLKVFGDVAVGEVPRGFVCTVSPIIATGFLARVSNPAFLPLRGFTVRGHWGRVGDLRVRESGR